MVLKSIHLFCKRYKFMDIKAFITFALKHKTIHNQSSIELRIRSVEALSWLGAKKRR